MSSLTAARAELAGAFAYGYTPEDVDHVAALVWRAYGLVLVCVWDEVDRSGPRGGSELGVAEGGAVHDCDEIVTWLCAGGPAPADPRPGAVLVPLERLAWAAGRNLVYRDQPCRRSS